MKLPPLRILQLQAEGIILEGDWPPVPVAGGKAVVLGLKAGKQLDTASSVVVHLGRAARFWCVTAQLGFVWLWEAEHHPFMALLWELLLLRGNPWPLQPIHVPLEMGKAAVLGAAAAGWEGTKSWR